MKQVWSYLSTPMELHCTGIYTGLGQGMPSNGESCNNSSVAELPPVHLALTNISSRGLFHWTGLLICWS